MPFFYWFLNEIKKFIQYNGKRISIVYRTFLDTNFKILANDLGNHEFVNIHVYNQDGNLFFPNTLWKYDEKNNAFVTNTIENDERKKEEEYESENESDEEEVEQELEDEELESEYEDQSQQNESEYEDESQQENEY